MFPLCPCSRTHRALQTARGVRRVVAALGLSALCLMPASAQVIHSIDTAGGQRIFPLGAGVTFRIEFRELTGSPWCGFAVDFGDGVIREFRVGTGGVLDFPMILPYAYTAEGDYTARVSGKFVVMGGLLPIQPCRGESSFVRIRIQDEKKRNDQEEQVRARLAELEARLSRQSAVIDQFTQREQQQRQRLDELDGRLGRQTSLIEQQQRLIDALQKRPDSQPFPVALIVEIQALREQARQAQAEVAQVRQSQASSVGASEQRLQGLEQRQSAVDGRQRLLDERFQLLSERQRLLEGRARDVSSSQPASTR